MKQHKIIMLPVGCSIMPKHELVPEDAKWIGCSTEAALIGTMLKYKDGSVTMTPGLLAQDKTFFIEKLAVEILNRPQLWVALKAGKVYKRLAIGTLEYDIKAKLIIACQPFVPSESLKAVFEIVKYEPPYVTAIKKEQ